MQEPREGCWFAPPRPLEPVHDHRFLRQSAAVVLVSVLLLVALATAKGHRSLPDWVFIGVPALLGLGLSGLLAYFPRIVLLRVGRPRDAAFRDRALAEGEHPVEAVVFVRGRPVGADRGVVAIRDGLLAFHGAATSFCLAAQDVALDRRFAVRDLHRSLPGDAFRLRVPEEDAFVRLIALDGHDRGLARDLGTFVRQADATSEPRQWPPLAPYEKGATLKAGISPNASDREP